MHSSTRFSPLIFIALLATAVSFYGVIHWRVIWMQEPVALREPAVIIGMRGYLNPDAPRLYTLESLPEYTNLYGMGYIWAAAPFAKWLPFSEYSNLRLANAFFLAVLLITIVSSLQKADWFLRAFIVVAVYCIFVRSPSMAASPDVLGCLLYTLSWVVAVRGRFGAWPLVCSVVISAGAFLTKPYCVLGVGGIATYLFLFRSKKIGLAYTGGAGLFFVLSLLVVKHYYPYYFEAVVGVHAAATSRRLVHGLKQWGEFAALLPVCCILAAIVTAKFIKKQATSVKILIATEGPLINLDRPPTGYGWGAAVAAAALAVSLSWHGGAYLIYFSHLLLPLLVLSVSESDLRARIPLWVYCLNIASLLVLAPSLPLKGASHDWLVLQSAVRELANPYLDPYFESLRRPGRPISDNGQSEYLLIAGSLGSEARLREMSRRFAKRYVQDFEEQKYDALILIRKAYFHVVANDQIEQNYQLVADYKVRPYYQSFLHPIRFGVDDAQVVVYLPKPRTNKVSPAN